MALACREHGAGRVSVADAVTRARVSRRTFYEHFHHRDDCLMATLQEGLRRAAEHILPAYHAESQWREAIRAAIDAFLAFLDAERTFASLLVIDSLAAGDTVLTRRSEILRVLIEEVDKGRSHPRSSKQVSRHAAECAVGGVMAILHERLLSNPAKPVSPLAGELTALIVQPYMGAATAAKEAARPASRRKVTPAQDGDPLAGLNMRLTDRTLRVLHGLAESSGTHGGMSNRQVGEAAGIADPGQVSKLLARLAERDLVSNDRNSARAPRSSNSWRLTRKGVRLVEALGEHAER